MVKSGRGACRFQWRVCPIYSGVTYDLLVSKHIGGTYDIADQLPSNHEFGNFLVVSLPQVPREFGVNLALENAVVHDEPPDGTPSHIMSALLVARGIVTLTLVNQYSNKYANV